MSRGLPWALLLALGLAGAARAENPVGELEVLRRAIEEHRERVDGFEQQERGLLETLEGMDRAVEALAADARRARRAAREARARLTSLEGETAALEAKLVRTRRALTRRAVALYKAGALGPVRALFSADSLPDALARLRTLRRLVGHDQELLDRHRSAAVALAEARSEAQQAALARDASAARLVQRERELARERAARRTVLARVRGDRSRTRAALQELEAAAAALEEALERLGETPGRSAPESGRSFASRRGALPPPVEQGRIVEAFGRVVDPEFGTEILRKGVVFDARAGTPVRAVAAGEVRFTGWFRGYGKIVILDHGGGFFSVSGHLDRIDAEPGERAAAGSRLGTVGDSGSLAGPRLYFELRRGGEALDPADWLRRTQQG